MYRTMADCENFSRRDFMHVGALSMLGGMTLPQLLCSEAAGQSVSVGNESVESNKKPRAKNMIMIWLSGGPSTIDMWDLKPQASAGIRGEFKPIATSADGVEICEHLPRVAKIMDQCALIRSVSHTIAEHGLGTEFVSTGNPISPALKYPAIGSVVSHLVEPEKGVPGFMDLSDGSYRSAGFLGAAYNPLTVTGFNNFQAKKKQSNLFDLPEGFTLDDLNRRSELLRKLDGQFKRLDETKMGQELSKFQQQAADIYRSEKTKMALDLSLESEAVREKYGFSPLGRSALAARRLIQAGVRFVTIGLAGWDTHNQIFGQLRNNLLPVLDGALATLITDLKETGLLEETIVYCAGEFNRTPSINGSGGRDHWARAMSVFVAGGGFKSGTVYGATGNDGYEPTESPCSPTDVNATLLNQLGIPPETILHTPSGRPVEVFREGNVLTELIA